jgi:hypothetical protein
LIPDERPDLRVGLALFLPYIHLSLSHSLSLSLSLSQIHLVAFSLRVTSPLSSNCQPIKGFEATLKETFSREKNLSNKKRENFCESTNFDLQTETEITQKYKYLGIKK